MFNEHSRHPCDYEGVFNTPEHLAKTLIMHYNEDLLKGKNVLLIEDDEVDQVLIGRMISDQGGNLILEANKDLALEHLRNQRPDLIVLDTTMEGVNALEYTKNLKDKLKVRAPIIGLTSVNFQGRGIYHGLDRVLRKPIDYSSFKEALQNLLN